MTVDAGVWLQRFAEEVATAAPAPEERESLLALAGVAAHARDLADEVDNGEDGTR